MVKINILFVLLILVNCYSIVKCELGYVVLSDQNSYSAQYYQLDLCFSDKSMTGNSYDFSYDSNSHLITFTSYDDIACTNVSFSNIYNFYTLYNGTTMVDVDFSYNNPPIPSNSYNYIKSNNTVNNCTAGGYIYQAGYVMQGQCVPTNFLSSITEYQINKCLPSGVQFLELYTTQSCLRFPVYAGDFPPIQSCNSEGVKIVYTCDSN